MFVCVLLGATMFTFTYYIGVENPRFLSLLTHSYLSAPHYTTLYHEYRYQLYVRAIDPAGNRDATYLMNYNVYNWYYLSPTPWDIILGKL